MKKIKRTLILVVTLAVTLSCGLPFNLSVDPSTIDEHLSNNLMMFSGADTFPRFLNPLPLENLRSADEAQFSGYYTRR
jgi:hypothetical protein